MDSGYNKSETVAVTKELMAYLSKQDVTRVQLEFSGANGEQSTSSPHIEHTKPFFPNPVDGKQIEQSLLERLNHIGYDWTAGEGGRGTITLDTQRQSAHLTLIDNSTNEQLIDCHSEYTTDSGVIDNDAVARAKNVLETTRLSFIQDAVVSNSDILADAERQVRELNESLLEHEANEPRQGLFSDKQAHAQWKATLDQKQAALDSKQIELQNIKEELKAGFAQVTRDARKRAHEKHPDETAIVEKERAETKKYQLMDKVNTLRTEIENVAEAGDPKSMLNTLHQQLNKTLNQLDGDKAASELLSEKERNTVDKAKTQVKARAAEKSLEKEGPGHEH